MLRLSRNGRAGLCVVVTVLAAAALIAAQEPEEPTETAPRAQAADARQAITRQARDAERRIRRGLQTEVTVTFKDKPLQEALRELVEKAGVPLWIDETALTEEGVSLDEPVSVDLESMSIETALELILSPFGLAWHIEDEVLKVTTETEASERLSTEIYDVNELLRLAAEAEREQSGADLALERATTPVQFDDAAAWGCFHPPRRDLDSATAAWGTRHWLVAVLFGMTSGAWDRIDGVGGTAQILDGTLVLRQTQRIHAEVAGLLDALTQAARGELAHGSVMVHPTGAAADKIQRIYDALAGKGTAEFKDATLRSALDSLGAQFDVPVIINEVALTEEGVSLEEPVSLSVDNVTLHSILKLLLEPLGLEAIVRFGVLEVTTETEAAEVFVTAIYDVRDLVHRGVDEEELLESIRQTTSGEWEWVDGVGGEGQVPFAGVLAVRNTQKVHSQAEVLLADLRRTLPRGEQNHLPQSKQAPDPDEVTTQLYRVDLQAPIEQVTDAISMFVAGELGDDFDTLTITRVGGALMIRAANRAHAEIRKCLQLLRQAEADSHSEEPGGVYGPDDWEVEGAGGGPAAGGGFFSAGR